jgi:hypothetical protein
MARPRRGPSGEAIAPRDVLLRRNGAQDGRLTDLGCPDCRGVLSVKVASDPGLLVFTCRIRTVCELAAPAPVAANGQR